MSRSRDRQKRRAREAWALRRTEQHKRAKAWSHFPIVVCSDCHGSGANYHPVRDTFGSDGPIGRYQTCRKCGGDGQVRAGMFEVKVTI